MGLLIRGSGVRIPPGAQPDGAQPDVFQTARNLNALVTSDLRSVTRDNDSRISPRFPPAFRPAVCELCSLRGVSSYWQSLPPVLKLAVILAAGIIIAAIGYFFLTLIIIALGDLGVGGS
jgi:hypothetical protein